MTATIAVVTTKCPWQVTLAENRFISHYMFQKRDRDRFPLQPHGNALEAATQFQFQVVTNPVLLRCAYNLLLISHPNTTDQAGSQPYNDARC